MDPLSSKSGSLYSSNSHYLTEIKLLIFTTYLSPKLLHSLEPRAVFINLFFPLYIALESFYQTEQLFGST